MTDAQEKTLLDNNSKINKVIGILSGGNGGGLVRDVQKTKDELDELSRVSVTKELCERNHNGLTTRRHRAFDVTRDIFLALLGAAVVYHSFWGGA